ncbi:hypothetical protein [Leptospira santarosai]|uniref:hypothetical protein n=3 Tax=Leptospira santarosai TaxID=28183 RepID=UPI0002487EA4|nr:hypothetical protein [Leptospira santarosai]
MGNLNDQFAVWTSSFHGSFQTSLGALGISQYKNPDQFFVPFVFYSTFQNTVTGILKHEKFIFQNYQYTDLAKERFIPTEDGGFVIFENPLEAILFALYFETYLREYNSDKSHNKIFEYLGPLKVRYGICHDDVYMIKNQENYFGTGIINCARMMSKDKLDRCLIDESTYNWFLSHFNGLESLRHIPYDHLVTMKALKDLKAISDQKGYEYKSYAFPNRENKLEPGIDVIMVMKVGTIQVKSNSISIYNLFMQMPYVYHNEEDKIINYVVASLGNNNAEGLID